MTNDEIIVNAPSANHQANEEKSADRLYSYPDVDIVNARLENTINDEIIRNVR